MDRGRSGAEMEDMAWHGIGGHRARICHLVPDPAGVSS